MTVIEAPHPFTGPGPALFLAGGISDAENWQDRLIGRLSATPLTILNPRRRSFPANDPDANREQIAWEFRHLELADAVAFYFPPQTLCPIALYELGRCTTSRKPLFVASHPDYARRPDLELQLSFARPDVRVIAGLDRLAAQVLSFFTAHREETP